MVCPPKSGSRVGEAEATGSGSAWGRLGFRGSASRALWLGRDFLPEKSYSHGSLIGLFKVQKGG